MSAPWYTPRAFGERFAAARELMANIRARREAVGELRRSAAPLRTQVARLSADVRAALTMHIKAHFPR